MNGQDDPGALFLTRLLALSERSPDRTRPASASPDYDDLPTAELVERFQTQILAAGRTGAVTVRWGERERRHLIERVAVNDAVALARHLGRSPASVVAAEARSKLGPAISTAKPWLRKVLADMEARWSRGEPAYRISSGELETAREFLTLLAAISNDQARGLDARTFSLRATGDTKAFDRHSARIATVMASQLGEPGLAAGRVWARLGLERFGHPVHLRGAIAVEDSRGVLVDGRARPFASIHPDMMSFLKLSGSPSYILTIENYASFNRHVREIEDDGLVVYTGGFASAGVIEILKWLLNNVSASIPFYHWGDIDPGGLRIFRYLEENLPRPPRPHLMERGLAEARGKPAQPDATLAMLGSSDSAVADLAVWLARGEDIRHLEQEAIDPVSPPPAALTEAAA